MAQEVYISGATYSDVPAIRLPDSNGNYHQFSDASVTTAVESDVAQGKIFLRADGTLGVGTGSGGGGSTREIVVPSQTIDASSTYTLITNYAEALVLGEQYICTVDGAEYGPYYGIDNYGSVAIGDITANKWVFEYDRGMYFTVQDTSLYGSHTVKVEKITSR